MSLLFCITISVLIDFFILDFIPATICTHYLREQNSKSYCIGQKAKQKQYQMHGIGSNNVIIPEAEKGIKYALYCLITFGFVHRDFNDASYNKNKIRLKNGRFHALFLVTMTKK